jgi:hypothetical protein
VFLFFIQFYSRPEECCGESTEKNALSSLLYRPLHIPVRPQIMVKREKHKLLKAIKGQSTQEQEKRNEVMRDGKDKEQNKERGQELKT